MKGHLPDKAAVNVTQDVGQGFSAQAARSLCGGRYRRCTSLSGLCPPAVTTESVCRHCQPNVPWGTKLAPVEKRWSIRGSRHTAPALGTLPLTCYTMTPIVLSGPSQPEIPEDRAVPRCLDKQVGGEVDGAERQVDRTADGQMGVSDSGSLSDQKKTKIHSDWGGFPEQNISGASV